MRNGLLFFVSWRKRFVHNELTPARTNLRQLPMHWHICVAPKKPPNRSATTAALHLPPASPGTMPIPKYHTLPVFTPRWRHLIKGSLQPVVLRPVCRYYNMPCRAEEGLKKSICMNLATVVCLDVTNSKWACLEQQGFGGPRR